MIKWGLGLLVFVVLPAALAGSAMSQEADADALEATIVTIGSPPFSPVTPCKVAGNPVNQCKYALATTKYVANAVQQSVDNASAKLELSLIGALDKLSHDAVAAEAVNLIKKDYDNRIDELQQKLTSLQRQLADLELQKTDESRHPRERAPSKQRTPKSPVPVHK